MNSYLVELVKQQVKLTKDFAWVKYYEKPNTFLIYHIVEQDPHLILFMDYKFEVFENCGGVEGLKLKASYEDLWDAINFVRANNGGVL